MASYVQRQMFLTAVIAGTAVSALAQEYALFDLGDLGNPHTTHVIGVANSGILVGYSGVGASQSHAFVWRNGRIQDLGVFFGCCSSAFASNSAGTIAGVSTSTSSFGSNVACTWDSRGQIAVLPEVIAGQEYGASAINEFDQVAGVSDVSPFEKTAVMWSDGDAIMLPSLGGVSSEARDISNTGTVVGGSRNTNNDYHACYWQDGIVFQLPLLAGNPTTIVSDSVGINDAGVIAGWCEDDFDILHCVIWRDGQIIDLHDPKYEGGSSATGINNYGEVSGAVYSGGEAFPAVWTGGGIRILPDFAPPKHKWTELRFAWGINDLGMVIGEGNFPPYTGTFDNRAWLMVPVTPKFSLAQPVPGLAGRRNTLTASGVTPGKKVYFVYGLQGGGSVIPGCDLAETLAAIQIENAKVIGSATANAQGVASLNTSVPDAARNAGEVLIQAVIPGDCVISNLVVEVFE